MGLLLLLMLWVYLVITNVQHIVKLLWFIGKKTNYLTFADFGSFLLIFAVCTGFMNMSLNKMLKIFYLRTYPMRIILAVESPNIG